MVEFILIIIIAFLFTMLVFFSAGMINSLLDFILSIIVSLFLSSIFSFMLIYRLPYDKNIVDTYNKYKQMLDNKIEIPICIEKIDEGIFREGKCLNNVIIKNNEQLISVINLLYKTDVEEQLKIYKEYEKENKDAK